MTPSPVYPCLQVQVLIPAATLVQTANSEHPPLDRLHKSSSERQKEKDEESVITLKDRFNDAVCVCVCVCLCSRFRFLHIQPCTRRRQLFPVALLCSCSRKTNCSICVSHFYWSWELWLIISIITNHICEQRPALLFIFCSFLRIIDPITSTELNF